MIDEIISKVGKAIRETLTGFLDVSWIPEIVFWYWWLFLLFLACGVVIWFFGWLRTVRAVASIVFLLGAVFVAGGHYMQHRQKDRYKRLEEKLAQRERELDDQQRGGRSERRWPW